MSNHTISPLVFLLFLFLGNLCFGQNNTSSTIEESQPEFPGGMEALYEYVNNHLKYPETAREADIEGKVFVQFVVDASGLVTNVKTVKGIGAGCDKEAERLVKNACKFTPGYKNGKPVSSRMIVPIIFSLYSKESMTLSKTNSPTVRPPAKALDEVLNDPGAHQLVLKFQGIINLDERIGDATQLTYLDLTGNELASLPDVIGSLINLREIHLTHNLIKELPATFSQLQSLRILYLDRNSVSIFPPEILELRNLETLDISSTGISELPPQITEMPNLKIIYARGTAISSVEIQRIREINPTVEILK